MQKRIQPNSETLQQIAVILQVDLKDLITDARAHVARSVNITEVITRYGICRIIVEVVQEGEERATYEKQLLQGVSDLLTERLGKEGLSGL